AGRAFGNRPTQAFGRRRCSSPVGSPCRSPGGYPPLLGPSSSARYCCFRADLRSLRVQPDFVLFHAASVVFSMALSRLRSTAGHLIDQRRPAPASFRSPPLLQRNRSVLASAYAVVSASKASAAFSPRWKCENHT